MSPGYYKSMSLIFYFSSTSGSTNRYFNINEAGLYYIIIEQLSCVRNLEGVAIKRGNVEIIRTSTYGNIDMEHYSNMGIPVWLIAGQYVLIREAGSSEVWCNVYKYNQ